MVLKIAEPFTALHDRVSLVRADFCKLLESVVDHYMRVVVTEYFVWWIGRWDFYFRSLWPGDLAEIVGRRTMGWCFKERDFNENTGHKCLGSWMNSCGLKCWTFPLSFGLSQELSWEQILQTSNNTLTSVTNHMHHINARLMVDNTSANLRCGKRSKASI